MTQDLQPRNPSSSLCKNCSFETSNISGLQCGMLVKVPRPYLQSEDSDKLEAIVTVLVLKVEEVNNHEKRVEVAVLDTKARSENFIELAKLKEVKIDGITHVTAQFGSPMEYVSLEPGCVLDPGLEAHKTLYVYRKDDKAINLASEAGAIQYLRPPFLRPIAYDQIPSGTLGEVSPDLLSAECFSGKRTGDAMTVVFLTDSHHEKPLQVAYFKKGSSSKNSVELWRFTLQELVSRATNKSLDHVILNPNCRLNLQHPNVSVKVYCSTPQGPVFSDSQPYPSLDVEHTTWNVPSKAPEPHVIKIQPGQVTNLLKEMGNR